MVVDLLLTMVIFIVLVASIALLVIFLVVSIGRANDWLDTYRLHRAFPDREPPSSRFGWLWFTPSVITFLFGVFGLFLSIYQVVSAM